MGARTRSEVSATPPVEIAHDQRTPRVITTGAPIAATNSACRADSTQQDDRAQRDLVVVLRDPADRRSRHRVEYQPTRGAAAET